MDSLGEVWLTFRLDAGRESAEETGALLGQPWLGTGMSETVRQGTTLLWGLWALGYSYLYFHPFLLTVLCFPFGEMAFVSVYSL